MRVRISSSIVSCVLRLAATALPFVGCSWDWERYRDSAGTTVPYPSVLHATASEPFVSPEGRAVMLRGFVVQEANGVFGPDYMDRFATIRAGGFTAVTLLLAWGDYEATQGTFDPALDDTIDHAIAYARAAGLYVIIAADNVSSMHATPTWAASDEASTRYTTDFGPYLAHIAAHVADQPVVAGILPLYGPQAPQSDLIAVDAALIAGVHAVAPHEIVLIDPSNGDAAWNGVDFGPLTQRDNVVLTFQDFYAGGAGAGYAADNSRTGATTLTGTYNGMRDDLEAHVAVQLAAASALHVPLWVAGFGVQQGTANWDAYVTDQTAVFKRHGLGYTWFLFECGGMTNPPADSQCNLLSWTSRLP